MERIEKPLVPEWLKVANGSTSGGSSHHLSPSSSQSDRSSSSYLHRSSSSNGAMMHGRDAIGHSNPYISFGRSHRERDWEEDLDFRSKDHAISDSYTLPSRKKKDMLRHSQSMISGSRGGMFPRRAGSDSDVGGNIKVNIQKSSFEREFPSLGTDEKQVILDTARVLPRSLIPASGSISAGSASVIGGEGWTSALAQLPVTVGSNGMQSVAQQAAPSSVSVAPIPTTGLNMAETVAQAPARTRTTPQLSVNVQRLEELEIKQLRQLIPMTPSMPKSLIPNSSEKLKSKTVRSLEMSTATKLGHQPCSQLSSTAGRGNSRSDISRSSQSGKLTVLNAARDKNDASPGAKDGQSLTNSIGVLPCVVPSAATCTSLKNHVNAKLATDGRQPVLLATKDSVDKRPVSQVQNRIDFFNSIRKKSSPNHTANVSDSSSVPEKSNEQNRDIPATVNKEAPASDSGLEPPSRKEGETAGNGDAHEDSKVELIWCAHFPEEEELSLLRSMGWDENAEESEPISEEEINSFYVSVKSRLPSKHVQAGKMPKFLPFGSQVGNAGSASSLQRLSDAEDEPQSLSVNDFGCV